jgi:chromosome segregation ATPase
MPFEHLCAGQEERLEELRDTHRLESTSFTQEADSLRQQLEDTKKSLQAAESARSKAEEEAAKHRAEVQRLKAENEKTSTLAKDEEEKRVKAVALLKTVRQKLVKTEKERDDSIKEANAMKGKDKEEVGKLRAEIDKVNAEREHAITGMRAHFDREVAGLRERQAKELTALRGQFELEAVNTKVARISRER